MSKSVCVIRKICSPPAGKMSTNSKTLFTAVSNFWTDGSTNRHNEDKKYVDGNTTDWVELQEPVWYMLNTCACICTHACHIVWLQLVFYFLCMTSVLEEARFHFANKKWDVRHTQARVSFCCCAGAGWGVKLRCKHLIHVHVSWSVKYNPLRPKPVSSTEETAILNPIWVWLQDSNLWTMSTETLAEEMNCAGRENI